MKKPYLSDRVLLIAALILVGFGLLMIYSSTGVLSQEKFKDTLYFVKRQTLSILLGVTLLISASFVEITKLRRYTPLFFFASVLLLLLVFIPGVGVTAGGARRWIDLTFLRFQPVELVKLLMIIFIAGFLAKNEGRLKEFLPGIAVPMLFVGIVGVLLLMQPDFGSAVVIAFVVLAMLLASGVRLTYFFLCGGGFIFAAALIVLTSSYRMQRVIGFLAPWKDSSGKGYQLIQSLIAVGSGQVQGLGLGEGRQKLFYLPAAHTDFIFAVIAEELGLLGCLFLMALFLLILWRGLTVAARFSHDTFAFSLAIGLTMLIVVPAFLNIGVVIGLLPTKGMVLPLVSYGGSSLVVSLFAIGLLLALGDRSRILS